MKRLTERQIVEEMHQAYLRRLHEVMGETDVRDARDNVVIQPGLKVRHKRSQYEYTVTSVEEDPKTGEVTIVLQNPEQPRFDAPGGEEFIGEETPLLTGTPGEDLPPGHTGDLMRQAQDTGPDLGPGQEEDGETVFVVDEKEFEKDYEVK